ncbi:MAG TPA: pyridoxal phosphate-dependent aminotransferase [Bacteroidia bacterium]|nr:pyridoxal phosphate-dependent aminotransferase [Bacteroidia bacterium]
MGKYSLIAEQSEQAMSIRYNTMVYELKRQGKKVLVMSLGEAYFDIPLFPMNDLPFPDVYHYSHSMGLPELREKLSKYFSEKYDIPFDYEKEIIVTAGSKIGVYMALMAILNPGDEVIVQEPCWVSYPEQIKLCYGVPVQVPSDKSIYEIENYITVKTKAIIISNPHNPTGNVYTEKELQYLLALAEKHNIWILSDEAYSDFVNDNSFISPGKIDREKKHTIIFNSISKNYGISGWRLGYIISNEKLIYQVLKINQHLMTCPATILEYYVTKYFDKILEITLPQINDLISKRHRLAKYMEEAGLKRMPGNATFYFFVSIDPSKLSSEEFCTRLLKEEYICVVPGIGYGKTCDRFIRVSIGTATYDENIYGLNKIKELIEKTS